MAGLWARLTRFFKREKEEPARTKEKDVPEEKRAAETLEERKKNLVKVEEAETLKSAPLKELAAGRILAVANQKGGVGKTTTAINLSAALALDGHKVLLVDVDPQGNATSGIGVDPDSVEICIYEVLMKREDLKAIVRPTGIEHLFLAPASFHLVGATVELVSVIARETRLKEALDPLRDQYHYMIVDCPPSLGLLTVNALVAADEIVIPVQCEYYALEGLSQLLDSIEEIRKYLNPRLHLAGLLMTMHDSRTKISHQVVEEVRKHFPTQVYRTVIPRSVRLSEAPSFGQPIAQYDPLSRGSVAYKDLAKEVVSNG